MLKKINICLERCCCASKQNGGNGNLYLVGTLEANQGPVQTFEGFALDSVAVWQGPFQAGWVAEQAMPSGFHLSTTMAPLALFSTLTPAYPRLPTHPSPACKASHRFTDIDRCGITVC